MAKSTVHITYRSGSTILEEHLDTGTVGTPYNYTQKAFEGYSFESNLGSLSGVYSKTPIEIVVNYVPNPACIDCDCTNVGCGSEACNELYDLNDTKVLNAVEVLRKSLLCDLAKNTAKAFHRMHCVTKNIINNICCLSKRMDCVEHKASNMCEVLKCEDARITRMYDFLVGELLKNVDFSMSSQGSSSGDTYTKVSTTKDGNFTLIWNMTLGNGVVVGNGTLTGRVNHIYTLNRDGSIHARIGGVHFNGINYTGAGVSGSSSANFKIQTASGATIFNKTYDPYKSWSASVNDINIVYESDLAPNGGTSGNKLMFKTVDTWQTNPTTGNVNAVFTNNNPALPQDTPCNLTCDRCE